MSRRSRNRQDKRAIAYYTGDAPDIDAAFARLTAERREKQEPEPGALQLKDGTTVDTKEWWRLPVIDARDAA